jgi:hypothetical protein
MVQKEAGCADPAARFQTLAMITLMRTDKAGLCSQATAGKASTARLKEAVQHTIRLELILNFGVYYSAAQGAPTRNERGNHK